MRVLILGGDGYLGWPTAMHFSRRGYEVMVVDNFCKRRLELELGVKPLEEVAPLQQRIRLWKQASGQDIALRVGDLLNHRFVYKVLQDFVPDAIIHYAEQPSAPYSMIGRNEAVFTQRNNVLGTLNLLFAIPAACPDTHLIKLGTMGEYGTPNIDIEEGFLEIEHNGRRDVLPFPKLPGSFYHLSKVHDSHNIMFACRTWNLRATDLNQGVVYGIETDETGLDPGLNTSFHYDHVFGTVINRFCAEAVTGVPLTVYGAGTQTRSFLNIRDTLQCVELAVQSAPEPGEYRVFNQFTEVFSIADLAALVTDAAERRGIAATIRRIENPRSEAQEHYYNPKNNKLLDLGLEPHLLSAGLIERMLDHIGQRRDRIDREMIAPTIKWAAR